MYASNSSSSSSASSSSGAPTSFPSKSPGARKVTVDASAGPYLDPVELQQMEATLKKCCNVVCHISPPAPGKRGCGFLIGPTLLLTCFHVLPNIEVARNSGVFLFQVVSRMGAKTSFDIVELSLDPDACFIQSPNHTERKKDGTETILPANARHLDFTVVAIKADPSLANIQDFVMDIFEKIPIGPGNPICVIQCPEISGEPKEFLRGDVKCVLGQVNDVGACTLTYNVSTYGGSSGGPIVNQLGKPVGMHSQRIDGVKTAVLTREIATFLNRLPEKKQEQIHKCRAPLRPVQDIFTPTRPHNLPYPNARFVGRVNELKDLHMLFQTYQQVAIVGLGGNGKSSLAVKYAYEHLSENVLTYFMSSTGTQGTQTSLLCLADELEIPYTMPAERRFKLLNKVLNQLGGRVLLIFDGIDDEEAVNFLLKYVPTAPNVRLLLSSRQTTCFRDGPVITMPIDGFKEDEAVNYLLTAVKGTDTDAEGATLLATFLGRLPLALSHAAAFIRNAEGRYTFRRYLTELQEDESLKLLGASYSLSNNEINVLTTWQQSINAILEAPQGRLAVDLLCYFSLLADSPIPTEFLRYLPEQNEADVLMAIHRLKAYSLVERNGESYVVHPLVRKTVRYQLAEKDKKYLKQTLHALYTFTAQLDTFASLTHSGRKTLGAYILHIESTILLLKEIAGDADNKEIYFLLHILWWLYEMDECQLALTFAEESVRMYSSREILPMKKAEILDSRGVALMKLEQYDEALKNLKGGLEIRKGGDDTYAIFESLSHLIQALCFMKYDDDAMGYFQQANRLVSQWSCPDSLRFAHEIHNLGVYLTDFGKYKEALECHLTALPILEVKDSEAARCHAAISICFGRLGQHEEALNSARKARKCGLTSSEEAFLHQQLIGQMTSVEGREEFIKAIKEEFTISPNPSNTILGNLGILLTPSTKYEQSYHKLQSELHVELEETVPNNSWISGIYQELALCCMSLQRPEEAVAYGRKSLEILKNHRRGDSFRRGDGFLVNIINRVILGSALLSLAYREQFLANALPFERFDEALRHNQKALRAVSSYRDDESACSLL